MKKIITFMLTLLMCVGMMMIFTPSTVQAATSGTYRGVSWSLNDDGLLTIGKEGETQTYTYSDFMVDSYWPWYIYRTSIKSVRFAGTVKGNGRMNDMFHGCTNLTSFDATGFDTSDTTCLHYLFHSCTAIESIDLSSWDMSSVTTVHNMFFGCSNFKTVNLSGWNLSSVSGDSSGGGLTNMFYNCQNLTSVDLSNWNTSNVKFMESMFNGCSKLEFLDLSSFDTNNMKNMNSMFTKCDSLKSIKLGEKFNFRGNNANSQTALLPGSDLGQWVREDRAYGPYTSAQLRDNYTSKMAGTWVWELKPVAIFSGDGTLSFIRPTADSIYTSGSTGTVRSISGGEYTGTIFTVDETAINGNRAWDNIASQVKKVQFVDEIKPKSTQSWFNGFSACTEMDLQKLNTSNVVNMQAMFSSCSELETIDLSNFNTSNVTNMSGMFGYCKKVKSFSFPNTFDTSKVTTMERMFLQCDGITTLDLTKFDTKNVENMQDMFLNCPNLKKLNLSSFDTSKVTAFGNVYYSIFTDDVNLSEVVLSPEFNFSGNNITDVVKKAILPTPPKNKDGVEYTGKWIREDKSFGPYTPIELRDNYTSAMAGTWVWEPKPTEYTISFEAGENGTGAMTPVNAPAKEDFTLPANQFVAFGYEFDHWDDGNGKTYTDKGAIPANTYAADKKVTLIAVWKKRDTSLNWDGNEATFSIRDGEQAVLDNIPAGTSYQVYELTPDGWVLVQQENASGVIEALEESAAAFWNKYQPGVTTVQFSGLKNLDGRPASAGAFTFELLENNEVIDSATTQDGGFIQFKVIEYDAAGDHVYTIREVDPNDDTIDYDTHEETVEVSVTDNGDGTLSSEVKYDDDGIVFSNATRPGTLRITKNATNGTSQNANDEFTIEIEFRNESGMPINDNIYWYIEGSNVSEGESVVPEE